MKHTKQIETQKTDKKWFKIASCNEEHCLNTIYIKSAVKIVDLN